MRKIMAVQHLSLDGVMQSPAGADEDVRGGFTHGGWAIADNDDVLGAEMGKGMTGDNALLFGRVTYQQLASVWPSAPQPNPFSEALNNTQKYVVSNTLTEPLEWVNSTLLTGDGVDAVAELKKHSGPDLVILGSGVLVRALLAADLMDEFMLMIHPVILGTGQRLFADGGGLAELALSHSVTSTTGVLIATYHRRAA